jgi:hypothetical protein
MFWMSSNVCSIVSSFLAYGILHMRGVLGYAGWRWLFLIEYVNNLSLGQIFTVNRGILTLLIGVATFFKMPPSPTQTKTWFRPKGWFSDREEIICVNRILRDDPSKVRNYFQVFI